MTTAVPPIKRRSSSGKDTIGRDELIDLISNDLLTTKSDASLILDSVVKAILVSAEKHKSIKVPNLGTFHTIQTPKRVGRNPRSGETVEIPPGSRITFRAARTLKKTISKK